MRQIKKFKLPELEKEKLLSLDWFKYSIYYPVYYRLIEPAKMFFKWHIPSFIARGLHGVSVYDTWAFDEYLSKVIMQGCTILLKTQHGHPSDLTQKQWNKILKQIIWTFKIERDISNGEMFLRTWRAKGFAYLTKKEQKKYDEGRKLFMKYYHYLWD